MLPGARGEFPSLGSDELGLEEGTAVQIHTKICSPFALGSEDTHHCCRCSHHSVILPFARRKLLCLEYRPVVPCPLAPWHWLRTAAQLPTFLEKSSSGAPSVHYSFLPGWLVGKVEWHVAEWGRSAIYCLVVERTVCLQYVLPSAGSLGVKSSIA